MKAAQFKAYGETEVIEMTKEAVKPQPKRGQILVEVKAAGINPVESAIRKGDMQQRLPLPFPVTLGGDFSGVVQGLGEGVSGFRLGDEVYGIANQLKGGSGAVAELVAANAANSALKPKSVDHQQAAGLPLGGASALQALEEHMALKAGQKILVQGGAGGIGSMAMSLAKSLGAYVVATVNARDVAFAKRLGADEVIDYTSQDFTRLVTDADAVLDTVGGEITNTSVGALKSGGILVTMAGQADEALIKKQGITVINQMTRGDFKQLTRLAQLVDEGKVRPVVDKTFMMDEAKEAYDYLEKGHPRGKVVIRIG